jgi:distribution and morphology protein 31
MTSSASTTQLGRQFWGSLRDSVTVLAARLPTRRPLQNQSFAGQFFFNTSHGHNPRFFHSARRFFQPHPSRISPKNVRKSCTSGGLLLLGLSSSPSSTSAVVTTCTAAADSALVGSSGQRANLSHLARQIWLQSRQAKSGPGHTTVVGKRASSSKAKGDADKSAVSPPKQEPEPPQQAPARTPGPEPSEHGTLADSMSKYLHLPKMPHRPTKEELLAAASGFGQRLKVRFKWFSIRSMRPWNADEWGAFVSWFLFGHIVWILVGTTTFFSLVILTINTVFAQGKVPDDPQPLGGMLTTAC